VGSRAYNVLVTVVLVGPGRAGGVETGTGMYSCLLVDTRGEPFWILDPRLLFTVIQLSKLLYNLDKNPSRINNRKIAFF
jgi:hypothetical protein